MWKEPKHLEQDKDGNWYDKKAADRVVWWFWEALQFQLLVWQKELLQQVFGWKRPDGTRKHRQIYLLIGRKNGKSTFGAALALYLLLADREPDPQVVGAADNRKQASLIFDMAARMVRRNPELADLVHIVDSSKVMLAPKTNARYLAISADADSAQGLNASVVIFDELHTQENRKLYDALRTCQIARKQPLMIMLTTAGDKQQSIWGEVHDHALKVRDGVVSDPGFLPIIYALEPGEDWTNPDLWHKANPSIGYTFPASALQEEVDKAKMIPAYANSVQRYYFNLATALESPWMPLAAWDACAGLVIPADLKHRPCRAGLDLANVSDFAALVLAFPPTAKETQTIILAYFWCPLGGIERRSIMENLPYRQWMEESFIEGTPGDAIDYAAILKTITGRNPDGTKSPGSLMDEFQIEEIAFDPWGAWQFSEQLEREGILVRPVRQGFRELTAPTKDLMRRILMKELNHGGNPILRWMVTNAQSVGDPADNIKLAKNKSKDRIDGLAALVMAIDGLMRRVESTGMFYIG